MDTGIFVALATSCAAFALTVVLFVVDRILRTLDEARTSRRVIIESLISSFERSTRALVRPVFYSVWWNSDVEDLLITARLHADLNRRDRVVATWLHRQAQLIATETDRKVALQRRATAVGRLLSWHHREIGRSWFEKEVKRDPVRPAERPSLKTRAVRLAQDSWSWGGIAVVVALYAILVKQAAAFVK
jgi:hypothetical protein